MPITTLPTQTEGSLGGVKSDTGGPYAAATDVRSSMVNEWTSRFVELYAEIGLSDGSTVGSINEAVLALIDAVIQHNVAATAAPTVTDDSAAGYAVGSLWAVTSGAASGLGVWIAKSAAVGAADWRKIEGKHNIVTTASAPSATDDEAAGYSVGSWWVTTGGDFYVCVVTDVGAALWAPVLTDVSSAGNPAAYIIVCKIPPRLTYETQCSDFNALVTGICAAVDSRCVAIDPGLVAADVNGDGVHPNITAGATKLGDAVWNLGVNPYLATLS